MQRSASRRSRRELSNSNEYLLDEIGVDTVEKEPLEVWGENSIQYSFASLLPRPPLAESGWLGLDDLWVIDRIDVGLRFALPRAARSSYALLQAALFLEEPPSWSICVGHFRKELPEASNFNLPRGNYFSNFHSIVIHAIFAARADGVVG